MSKRKVTSISLPLNRTAKIMSSAVGVETVDQETVALATKATEIFLMDFARRAYDKSPDANTLEYDDIQKLVHNDPRYDFLIDTTPKRIKFSEALKLVEEATLRRTGGKNTTGDSVAGGIAGGGVAGGGGDGGNGSGTTTGNTGGNEENPEEQEKQEVTENGDSAESSEESKAT